MTSSSCARQKSGRIKLFSEVEHGPESTGAVVKLENTFALLAADIVLSRQAAFNTILSDYVLFTACFTSIFWNTHLKALIIKGHETGSYRLIVKALLSPKVHYPGSGLKLGDMYVLR